MDDAAPKPLKIALLDFEPPEPIRWELMTQVQDQLAHHWPMAFFTKKSLVEMNHDVAEIEEHVSQVDADAWVVASGTRAVLEWFVGKRLPVFAWFGRRSGLEIAGAGADYTSALQQAVRRLIEHGHQRICMFDRDFQEYGSFGKTETVFKRELTKHGIPPYKHHCAGWSGGVKEFHVALEALFASGPAPTALILNEPCACIGAMSFFNRVGLQVPRDVSLICENYSRDLMWCMPCVAHIQWDRKRLIRHVVRWAERIAIGEGDTRQHSVNADYIVGESVGPAPKG